MKIFSKLFNTTERVNTTIPKGWRQGMWVITETGEVGILFKLDTLVEVHIVDPQSGETTRNHTTNYNSVRQAKWSEIPACRKSITLEQGEALGYGA